MSDTSRETILIHWERFPRGGSNPTGLKEAGGGGGGQVQRPEGVRGRREVGMAGAEDPSGRAGTQG